MDNQNEMFKMLSDENKKLIQEAIEQKVNEAKEKFRDEVEAEIREEFTRRYENDRGILVEAMDRMLSDAISAELKEFQTDRKDVQRQRIELSRQIRETKIATKKKLAENVNVLNDFVLKQLSSELAEFSEDRKAVDAQRIKLSKQIVEAKKAAKVETAKHLEALQTFVLKQLSEEMQEFAQDRRLLQEQRIKMQKQLKETQSEYRKQLNERVKALEGFVLRQLTNEMKEFNDDRKALVESRVKLVTEGKKKFNETRATFIKNAAKLVETTIETTLRAEMTQYKDDLKVATQNNFGRQIFEAFAAEYMSSYLAEGTEIRKLQREMADKDRQLAEAATQLQANKKVLTEAQTRIRRAEDAATRTTVLNECLKNLARDKRVVMEELLENVATKNLKEAFNKYLPSVIGTEARLQSDGRKKLVETNKTASKPVAVTGNRNNRLSEAAVAESIEKSAFDAEIIDIKKMAGIY